MDTGLNPELEALIAKHPGHTFSQNKDTGVWVAVEYPTLTSEAITWGHDLRELAAKLDGTAP